MKELKIGKISSKELAEWFGISYDRYRKIKTAKLEELKLYAEFDEIYGGVNITKLLDENNIIYTKDRKKNYDLIKNSFNEE